MVSGEVGIAFSSTYTKISSNTYLQQAYEVLSYRDWSKKLACPLSVLGFLLTAMKYGGYFTDKAPSDLDWRHNLLTTQVKMKKKKKSVKGQIHSQRYCGKNEG